MFPEQFLVTSLTTVACPRSDRFQRVQALPGGSGRWRRSDGVPGLLRCFGLLLSALLVAPAVWAAGAPPAAPFPRELSAYADPVGVGVWEVIKARAAAEPFNVGSSFGP